MGKYETDIATKEMLVEKSQCNLANGSEQKLSNKCWWESETEN